MSVEHHETHFAHTLNSQEEIETTGRGAKVTDVESVRVKDPRLKMAVRGGGGEEREGWRAVDRKNLLRPIPSAQNARFTIGQQLFHRSSYCDEGTERRFPSPVSPSPSVFWRVKQDGLPPTLSHRQGNDISSSEKDVVAFSRSFKIK